MMNQAKKLRLGLLGFVLALLTLSPISASFAKPSPSPEAIHVIGRMTVTLSQAESAEFKRLTNILLEKTQQLDQPAIYTCNEDIVSPGTYVWDEIWSSKAALDKHLSSDHFKNWWSWVEPRLSGPLTVLYVSKSEMKSV
jgi:quinol monooxygenase YgiN